MFIHYRKVEKLLENNHPFFYHLNKTFNFLQFHSSFLHILKILWAEYDKTLNTVLFSLALYHIHFPCCFIILCTYNYLLPYNIALNEHTTMFLTIPQLLEMKCVPAFYPLLWWIFLCTGIFPFSNGFSNICFTKNKENPYLSFTTVKNRNTGLKTD